MAHSYSSLLTAVITRGRWVLLLLLVAARGLALAQTITSLAPASGPVGTSVTITGTNLTGATSVRFNGTVQSTILSNTATSLAVAVPAGATTGLVTVTTAAGTSSGRSFTVTAVPLAITAVSPTANVRNAAVNSPVSVTFNQDLASTSASALKVHSTQRGGLRTRGTTPGVVSGSTLAYTPTQPWVAGETVQSTVTTAATGSAGGTLAKAKVMRFTAAVAGTGRGVFSGTTNYSVPVSNGNTDYLAMGDVDGDGDLDMLTANDNPNGTVSVRVNNGTGTFSGSQSVAVDGFPRVVKLADVDGDGDLDFLAVNSRSSTANSAYGSSVSIRVNNGAGVFGGTQNVETGDFSYGLDIGDLDGDGDLDFATANYSSSDVRVRLNDGTGIFSTNVTISLPGIYPQAVALGDVDGDGDLDMLSSGGSGTVSVQLNNGNATFSAGTSASAYADYNLTLGDVDGDNDLDLVAAAQNSNNVQIRLNNGAGVFSGGQNVSVTTGPRGVALGDLDADGDLDLVTNNIGLTTNYGNTVSVRFNNGAGVFSAQATTPDLVVGTLPWNVALADIDGDNDLDVLTANNNSTVSLRFNGLVTAPTITSFTPASGIVGTLVTVTGTDLANATAVKLNGVAITSYTVVNTATVTFTVPAGATSGLIAITTPLGTATSATPFTVTLPNAVPTITSLSPSAVLVNSGAFTLTVNGTGFVSGSVVNFLRGAVPTTFVSATQLTAAISAADLTDLADFNVTVTNPTPGGGTSGGARFQVYLPAPTITSFTPASGPVGTTVTVQGTNFQLVTNVGLVAPNNTYIAAYTVVNATTITFTVPAGSATGLVGVATSGGTAYSATNFTVTASNPAPTLTALSPATAVAGSGAFALTVSGTGFLASSVVSFNGTALPTTYVSATQLTAAVPAAAVATAGSFAVRVTSPAPGGGTSAALAFVVTVPAPTITSFTPGSGLVGTLVTVTGTNFTGATALTLNGAAIANFTTVNATTLTFVVPAGASSGLIAVSTPGGTATSTTTFTVIVPNPAPTLLALSPATAVAGSGAFTLVVNGTGFIPTSVVGFNGAALPTTYLSATQLTAAVPASAVAVVGQYTVAVVNAAPGGGSSSAPFTVTAPAPTIASFTPGSGLPGTLVTVTGTNFTGATTLTLNGAAITGFAVVNATTLTFVVPAGASSGLIVVSTPGGTATSTTAFTVIIPNPAPTITALSPATAVAGSGAFTLTVSGTGFLASSVVSFNGTALTTTYVSATQLTAAVPAAAVASAGSFAVRVTSPAPGGGTSAALAFVVTVPAPTITSFTPAGGSTGTVVSITGTNFTGATQVRIGSSAVPAFTVVSATSITLVVPGGFTASGLIAVTTPGGTATSTTPFGLVLATTAGQALPELSVYPNPFQTTLTVALPNPDAAQVTLRDVTGRLVLSSRPLPTSRQLLLPANLATGIYFLEVRQGELTTTRRVVKQ